jgi:hypothetical protein
MAPCPPVCAAAFINVNPVQTTNPATQAIARSHLLLRISPRTSWFPMKFLSIAALLKIFQFLLQSKWFDQIDRDIGSHRNLRD